MTGNSHRLSDFKETIETTLKNLQARLDKESKMEAERKKATEIMEQSKTQITHLQNEQQQLLVSLQEAKISQVEYEKKNEILKHEIMHTQERYQATQDQVSTLKSALDQSKADASKREASLQNQINEANRGSNREPSKFLSRDKLETRAYIWGIGY